MSTTSTTTPKTTYYGLNPSLPPHHLLEQIRNQLSGVAGKIHDLAKLNELAKDRLPTAEGGLYCVQAYLHSVMDELFKSEMEKHRGLQMGVRGIGMDNCPGCFVCGNPEPGSLLANLSGFVTSKEDGEAIVAMFSAGARLDYRPSEPNWIQVKVGACEAHIKHLQELSHSISLHGYIIRQHVWDAVHYVPPVNPAPVPAAIINPTPA